MTYVFIRENESIDEALRRFKLGCDQAGIFYEMKKREAYEKPSIKRHRKNQEIRYKFKKIAQKSKKLY